MRAVCMLRHRADERPGGTVAVTGGTRSSPHLAPVFWLMALVNTDRGRVGNAR